MALTKALISIYNLVLGLVGFGLGLVNYGLGLGVDTYGLGLGGSGLDSITVLRSLRRGYSFKCIHCIVVRIGNYFFT